MVSAAKSRRHLECRSFKLERRTITPGSIVPRLEFVSSVGCSLVFVAALQTARRQVRLWLYSALVTERLDAQAGLAVIILYNKRGVLAFCNRCIFAGGEDMGYFDCYSGGRGFESRRSRCS